jgi:HD-GYP domain-containing protein (c-di-GMP phosphodiesterase class II)
MERPYREARPREEAFDVLSTEASKGWRDRALVDAFVDVVSDPPPQSLSQSGFAIRDSGLDRKDSG